MNGTRHADAAQHGFPLRAAIAVFLLAWIARGLYLVVATRADSFGGLFLDSRLYAESAAAIRTGDAPILGRAPYLLSPLYPVFLSFFPSMSTPPATNPALDVRLIQAGLGALTCALASLAAGRLAGRRAGWIAGIAAALYGPAIHFDGTVLVASLSALCLTGALGSLLAAQGARRSTTWMLAAGVCLGLAATLRPTALLSALALASTTLLVGRTARTLSRRGRDAAALLLGSALALAPFALQNRRAGEPLLLTAGGGFNFWIGNHAGADGTFRAPEGYDVLWDPVGKGLAERAEGRSLTYAEASDAYLARARADIAHDPLRWIAALGHKAWLFAHPMEIPQLGSGFAWYRARAWPLRFPLDARWVLLLALLAPLCRARRASPTPNATGDRPPDSLAYPLGSLAYPLVLLASHAVGVVLFFVTARYRAPILPTVIVLAAVAVDGLAHGLARRRLARPLALVAGALLVGWLGFRTGPDIPLGAVEERQRGLALFERGAFADSVEVLTRAAEDDRSPKTRVALALALRAVGRDDDARRELGRALELRTGDPDATFHLAILIWETQRDAGAARALFQRSISARPGFADAHFNLAAIELASGHMAEAERSFVTALELAPRDAEWRSEAERGLGLARRELGRR